VSYPECLPAAQQAIRDHILMREVFHCTPEALGNIDEEQIALHWTIREGLANKERKGV
jgi:hypothetical protein